MDIYRYYIPTTWDKVKIGDTIYVDSYENGKFPKAKPKICGPYKVESAERRILKSKSGSFMHYPNNLLERMRTVDFKIDIPDDCESDPDRRFELAILQVREQQKDFVIPCDWEKISDTGNVVKIRRISNANVQSR